MYKFHRFKRTFSKISYIECVNKREKSEKEREKFTQEVIKQKSDCTEKFKIFFIYMVQISLILENISESFMYLLGAEEKEMRKKKERERERNLP